MRPLRRRRSPRRLLKGLAFLLICGGLVAFIVYSPLFTLQRVRLQGNTYITETDILTSGRLHKGQPLFQLETSEVTQNLLRDLRIESAVVRRRLPDTLEVEITERTPVATVACDYGYLDLDRQGKVIGSYKSLRKMPIPMITGVKMHDMYIGDDNKDTRVAKVLVLLASLNQEAINSLSEISVANPEAVTAYTNQSVQIRLGNFERWEEKAEQTKEFLHNLPNSRHQIEFVDFSYTAPFIRLKDKLVDPEAKVNAKAQ
ncbi:MAG: FtsQ-type POTRA domain-containing protein [Selenomonas sp.]|nr:FtsQ-type POTRA domain-containing protein [Selenomonas sp.]MBQ1613861.1 FtsQ-type POTRA domain-containing protein [Selenomonas sp.]MBQ1920021.1 FtsQ-type POTRA domain-containing protein [Selenomonas sp.]MBQ2087065.1 FtsQ-type POTRA domain-containing protein [Selenomonas sp.]MBQ2136617.1 FtsQ-type POTRA domain-containing protein [Selenomonas sp.]